MIKYINKSIFNVNVDAIVNTVNCEGFMGKGLALEFALRYPQLLEDYKYKCGNKLIKIGKVDYFRSLDFVIVNFSTKDKFSLPSKLVWIEEGLKNFITTYSNYNIRSIAFPLLGCSNGGLNPGEVKRMMEKYLKDLPIDIYICTDSNKAEGKELEMINKFKDLLYEDLERINLTKNQIEVLLQNKSNINRFSDISKFEGIGKISYKNIHNFCYNEEKKRNEQITLF